MPLEYKIYSASAPVGLEHQVNAALRTGWDLHGNTNVAILQSGLREYSQAMTREIGSQRDE